MSILKFSSVDEVVKRCNASIYGLGAGVCTRDVGKALKVAEQLRAGTVWVSTSAATLMFNRHSYGSVSKFNVIRRCDSVFFLEGGIPCYRCPPQIHAADMRFLNLYYGSC